MHEAIQTVARFRTVAFWEGISFLILLFVAMPLKYGLGVDMAVRVVGLAHGLLFIAYVATLGLAWSRLGPRLGFIAFSFRHLEVLREGGARHFAEPPHERVARRTRHVLAGCPDEA